jgi:hypothetical protein
LLSFPGCCRCCGRPAAELWPLSGTRAGRQSSAPALLSIFLYLNFLIRPVPAFPTFHIDRIVLGLQGGGQRAQRGRGIEVWPLSARYFAEMFAGRPLIWVTPGAKRRVFPCKADFPVGGAVDCFVEPPWAPYSCFLLAPVMCLRLAPPTGKSERSQGRASSPKA